ncbi:hypothetical protein WBG78_14510 [Chryseolinea sp. T2]|uniref:hypothetical protein n=1 Tax=Chryseolinea sp. T2 TaxID=3129255 RepID=UPI0030776077
MREFQIMHCCTRAAALFHNAAAGAVNGRRVQAVVGEENSQVYSHAETMGNGHDKSGLASLQVDIQFS